jgi:hypothetical protein
MKRHENKELEYYGQIPCTKALCSSFSSLYFSLYGGFPFSSLQPSFIKGYETLFFFFFFFYFLFFFHARLGFLLLFLFHVLFSSTWAPQISSYFLGPLRLFLLPSFPSFFCFVFHVFAWLGLAWLSLT